MRPTIKLLTLWQPWATAMALRLKRNETRHWKVQYRGLVAISAAQKHDGEIQWECDRLFRACPELRAAHPLPFGKVLCVGWLARIHRTEDIKRDLSQTEVTFGNYDPDRYAWEFPKMLPLKHIAARGCQGFGECPPALVDSILEQLPFLAGNTSGICSRCGCTHHTPCIDHNGAPCGWTDSHKTVCTHCHNP